MLQSRNSVRLYFLLCDCIRLFSYLRLKFSLICLLLLQLLSQILLFFGFFLNNFLELVVRFANLLKLLLKVFVGLLQLQRYLAQVSAYRRCDTLLKLHLLQQLREFVQRLFRLIRRRESNIV